MLTFAVFFGLAVVLTFIAFKSRMILFRMAGMLGWLGIGILAWTSPATVGIVTFPEGAKYVISLICVVMLFAIATMHMQSEIRHEELVRGKQAGYPGAESASWTTWGPTPGKKKPTKNQMALQRQADYKAELKDISRRAAKRRRRY